MAHNVLLGANGVQSADLFAARQLNPPPAAVKGVTDDEAATTTTTSTGTRSSTASRTTTPPAAQESSSSTPTPSSSHSSTTRSSTSRSTSKTTRSSTTKSQVSPSTPSVTHSGTLPTFSTTSDTISAINTLPSESSSASGSSFQPAPILTETTSTTTSDGAHIQTPSTTPAALAENTGGTSILKNTTASALIFTFTSLLAVTLLGLVFYCCLWKRRLRQQHVMLGEDDDDFARVGIMRNNSVSSRATRQRPMSAVSGMSTVTEGHYLPARFAGVPPISRGGFDTTRIEQDPFSVHRVIYPDRVPSPSDDSSHYVLYPDPIPPPAPLRFVAPRPPPPQSLQTWAVASHASEPLVAPTMPAVTMPVPRSPQRVKVPSLLPPVPSRPDSSDGHGPERDQPAASSTRAQSPESHYEEEDGAGAFHMPRRTYLIDRRPEKRRSQ